MQARTVIPNHIRSLFRNDFFLFWGTFAEVFGLCGAARPPLTLLLLFTGFTSVIQSNNEHDIVYSSGKNKSVKSLGEMRERKVEDKIEAQQCSSGSERCFAIESG